MGYMKAGKKREQIFVIIFRVFLRKKKVGNKLSSHIWTYLEKKSEDDSLTFDQKMNLKMFIISIINLL